MLPVSVLSLIIQVALIIHVIRTGRNQLWIFALAFLPFVGSLAYIIAELLPEMFGGRTARRARSSMRRLIDPDQELRRAATEVEVSGNVDARRRLAEEHYQRGQYDAAIGMYQAGLGGIFEQDPTLLYGLAQAQFAKQDFASARASLDRLLQHNPDFKSADMHLLLARTLESLGDLEMAERSYGCVIGAYPGAEARLRYGQLLKRRGKAAEADRVFKDILDSAKLGPAHYRKAQAKWLEMARRELG